MGQLTIRTRSLSTQAEYVDATSGLRIELNYNEDAVENTLTSISGSINSTDGNTYIGNFSGTLQDGEIAYSVNGVKSKDMAKVFAALTDIETQIKGEDNNDGGNEE